MRAFAVLLRLGDIDGRPVMGNASQGRRIRRSYQFSRFVRSHLQPCLLWPGITSGTWRWQQWLGSSSRRPTALVPPNCSSAKLRNAACASEGCIA
jgi:hypothetical protein